MSERGTMPGGNAPLLVGLVVERGSALGGKASGVTLSSVAGGGKPDGASCATPLASVQQDRAKVEAPSEAARTAHPGSTGCPTDPWPAESSLVARRSGRAPATRAPGKLIGHLS